MCCSKEKKGCEKPEKLKGRPEDCPPRQVRRCHGDAGKHPCTAPARRK